MRLMDKKLFINLEFKTPFTGTPKEAYDYRAAMRLLHKLINDLDYHEFCQVSSFDPEAIRFLLEID